MSQIKIRNRANNLSKILSKRLAFNGCLVLILSFLLIFGHSHSLSGLKQTTQHALQSSLKFDADSNQHKQIPLESHQTPEIPDEVETSDSSDDCSNKLFSNYFSANLFEERAGKSLLQHLKHSAEERPQVSLFILHHSWKSFLS